MKFLVSKAFTFSAAHHLTKVPKDHKCARPHGHNYRVEVVVEGHVDKRGMVLDFAEIEAAWQPLKELFDHRDLNKVPGLKNPTSEVLAAFVFGRIADELLLPLVSVRVAESADTYAEVRR